MTLPKVVSEHKTVDIGGALFDLRILTRGEAAMCAKLVANNAGIDEIEKSVIAAATDTPIVEVDEWYAKTDSWVVADLVEHIRVMSRLDAEGAQKSGAEGDSAR